MHQQIHRAINKPRRNQSPQKTHRQRNQHKQSPRNSHQQPRSRHRLRHRRYLRRIPHLLTVISRHLALLFAAHVFATTGVPPPWRSPSARRPRNFFKSPDSAIHRLLLFSMHCVKRHQNPSSRGGLPCFAHQHYQKKTEGTIDKEVSGSSVGAPCFSRGSWTCLPQAGFSSA